MQMIKLSSMKYTDHLPTDQRHWIRDGQHIPSPRDHNVFMLLYKLKNKYINKK